MAVEECNISRHHLLTTQINDKWNMPVAAKRSDEKDGEISQVAQDIVKALIYPISVGFGDLISDLRSHVASNETIEDVSRNLGLGESFRWLKTCQKWFLVFGSGGNTTLTRESGMVARWL